MVLSPPHHDSHVRALSELLAGSQRYLLGVLGVSVLVLSEELDAEFALSRDVGGSSLPLLTSALFTSLAAIGVLLASLCAGAREKLGGGDNSRGDVSLAARSLP